MELAFLNMEKQLMNTQVGYHMELCRQRIQTVLRMLQIMGGLVNLQISLFQQIQVNTLTKFITMVEKEICTHLIC